VIVRVKEEAVSANRFDCRCDVHPLLRSPAPA
jgi:hypothetical protein